MIAVRAKRVISVFLTIVLLIAAVPAVSLTQLRSMLPVARAEEDYRPEYTTADELPNAVWQIYKTILIRNATPKNDSGSEVVNDFTLCDIDGNGIPELIYNTGDFGHRGGADYNYYIVTADPDVYHSDAPRRSYNSIQLANISYVSYSAKCKVKINKSAHQITFVEPGVSDTGPFFCTVTVNGKSAIKGETIEKKEENYYSYNDDVVWYSFSVSSIDDRGFTFAGTEPAGRNYKCGLYGNSWHSANSPYGGMWYQTDNTLYLSGSFWYDNIAGRSDLWDTNQIKSIVLLDGTFTFVPARNYFTQLQSVWIYDRTAELDDPYYKWITDDVTIYGYKDSTAEAFAKKYGNRFIPIDGSELEIGADGYYMLTDSNKIYERGSTEPTALTATLHSGEFTGDDVKWSSSDPSVLTVTAGSVTKTADDKWETGCFLSSHSAGKATLKAYVDDNISAAVTVYVEDPKFLLIQGGNVYTYVGTNKVYTDDGDGDRSNDLVNDTVFFELFYGNTGLDKDDVTVESSDPETLEVTDITCVDSLSENTYFIKCSVNAHKKTESGRPVDLKLSVGDIIREKITVDVVAELMLKTSYESVEYSFGEGYIGGTGAISDSYEIYVQMTNVIPDMADFSDADKDNMKKIGVITLTAEVTEGDLSFSPDYAEKKQNLIFNIAEPLLAGESVDCLLELYGGAGASKVKLTLTGDDLDAPIETELSLEVRSGEQRDIEAYRIYTQTDSDYRLSKQNIMSREMYELRDSKEYKWDKFLNHDITNYYDIVVADVLSKALYADSENEKSTGSSLLAGLVDKAEIVKSFTQKISDLASGIKNAADLKGIGNIDQLQLVKLIKKSKYVTEPDKVKDRFRDTVTGLLKNADQAATNKVFAAFEKGGILLDVIGSAWDMYKTINDYAKRLALYDAYTKAADTFRAAVAVLALKCYPHAKLNEAFMDYVNYDMGGFDKDGGLFEEFIKAEVKFIADGVKLVSGVSIGEFMWKLVSDVILTEATALGISIGSGLFLGYTCGGLLSDILCNTKDKNFAVSKIISASELSEYVISALDAFESDLYDENADAADAGMFRAILSIHRACQISITENTIAALEAERDSFIIRYCTKHFGMNRDYDGAIKSMMALQEKLKGLSCDPGSIATGRIVTEVKVISIKCPVDITVRDADGVILLKTENDKIVYVSDALSAAVCGSEKYFAAPSGAEFYLTVSARDAGSMDYSVSEFGSAETVLRTIGFSDIPLEEGREFCGIIPSGLYAAAGAYELTAEGVTFPEAEVNVVVGPGEYYLAGDTNLDGVIDASDARLALRASANLEKLSEAQATVADVNGDGVVLADDARQILRYSAKLQKEFTKINL
ncbi:MAG: hypothetical protein K6G90_01310, partial [Clostridia bacterium]|nr:hypothetical protein [Clostridia bacterium]